MALFVDEHHRSFSRCGYSCVSVNQVETYLQSLNADDAVKAVTYGSSVGTTFSDNQAP